MLRTMHAASVSAPTSLPPSRSPRGATRGRRGCSESFCSAGGSPPSLLLPPARSLRRCPRLGRCLSRRWFRLDLQARTLWGGAAGPRSCRGQRPGRAQRAQRRWGQDCRGRRAPAPAPASLRFSRLFGISPRGLPPLPNLWQLWRLCNLGPSPRLLLYGVLALLIQLRPL